MLRLGIIDCDSSHCVEFVKRFHHINVASESFVEGARVVRAWPGDDRSDQSRIPGFVRQLRQLEVEIVEDLEALVSDVDGILILSVGGHNHRSRMETIQDCSLPIFIDKPLACDVASAERIAELANLNSAPVWSSSALRFSAELVDLLRSPPTDVVGASTWGPALQSSVNPGLYHYAIHGIEMLFTLMGNHVTEVQATSHDRSDFVMGTWSDGRIGTYRGLRTQSRTYGFQVFRDQSIVRNEVSTRFAYRNLCQAIIDSFRGETPLVSLDSSLHVVRFIEAAHESIRRGGTTVTISA